MFQVKWTCMLVLYLIIGFRHTVASSNTPCQALNLWKMKIRKSLNAFTITIMLIFLCSILVYFKSSWIHLVRGRQLSNSDTQYSGSRKTINVLLLAYGRSGSSFTGELLTSADDAFYVFEPSFEYALKRHLKDVPTTLEIIDDIYNCKKETLEMLAIKHIGDLGAPFFFPKAPKDIKDMNYLIKNCSNSAIRVIKTIHLSMETAHQLMLAKPSLNLKIVHLVRDPRAIINSLNKKKKGHWGEKFKNKIYKCDTLRRDLKESEYIPEGRYVRVRYEDLSTKTLETAVRMFESVDLPITNSLASYISEHVGVKEIKIKDKRGNYFTTYKTKEFDPNQWRYSMKLEDIIGIEAECKDVFAALNYEFYRNMNLTNN